VNDESLDAVLLIEALELMLEGVIERPLCRYEAHLPWVWWNDAGRPTCGLCHPPAGSEHDPEAYQRPRRDQKRRGEG
jgi:hypothetical protein